jgi:hypothetical protein
MEHTDDPSEVFAHYTEGVEVHEDKTVTISPDVQRDILNATAGLMHEHRKIFMILTIVMGMLIDSDDSKATIENVKDLLTAYFENPNDVHLHETDDPEEVKEILGTLRMMGGADEEVQN